MTRRTDPEEEGDRMEDTEEKQVTATTEPDEGRDREMLISQTDSREPDKTLPVYTVYTIALGEVWR